MKALVLGGTGFVGRAITEHLLADGHETTLFNRGRTPVPGTRQLIGDREAGDYASLTSGAWDAVVDVTGYFPHDVDRAMDALGDRAGRYCFISSHAVFDGAGPALRPAVEDAAPPLTGATYGPSKVACERRVTARFQERAAIVRPVKVAGPHDNQRGLTYWVRRAARGGPVALPADPRQPVQLVDARDLAAFVVRLLTEGRGGEFTAAGPVTDLAGLIHTCAAAAGTTIEVVEVPGTGRFPLVKSPAEWDTQRRESAAGIVAWPLLDTVRDVLTWDEARGRPPIEGGFSEDEERRVLAEAVRPAP